MSRSIWINGTADARSAASTAHVPVFGARTWAGGLSWYRTLISIDGTVCYGDGVFRVSLSVAPGVGEWRTFTVYKNGIATALTVTVAGTGTTGQDSAHAVDVSPGSYLYLRCTSSASPAAARLRFSMTLDGSTAGESILSGVLDLVKLLTDTDEYFCFSGSQATTLAVDAGTWLVFPCSGMVRKLHVMLSHAPSGIPPRSRVFTVYKNGVPGGRVPITCTISGADKTGSDTTHSFAVSAGDYIFLKCHPVAVGGNWPTATYMSATVAFDATNPGEFVIPSIGTQGFVTGPRFHQGTVAGDSWNATQVDVWSLAQSIELTRQQVLLSGAAGPDPWTGYLIRGMNQNGFLFDMYCSLLGNDTSDFAVGSEIMADDDLFVVYGNVVGVNPSKRMIATSYLAEVYVPPPPPPSAVAALLMSNF